MVRKMVRGRRRLAKTLYRYSRSLPVAPTALKSYPRLMTAKYETESPRERALAARDVARQRLDPDATKPEPKVAAEGSNPCDGWFYAAIATFKLADAAQDDETFFALFEEGQSYIAIGQACQETLDTL